jgi:hypothetical protein
MKNKYRLFLSLFKKDIKYNIRMIKYYNNIFYLTDEDLYNFNFYQNKLNDIKNMFNLLFDQNISLYQFVSIFNNEV